MELVFQPRLDDHLLHRIRHPLCIVAPRARLA